jgi:hypothetical protein
MRFKRGKVIDATSACVTMRKWHVQFMRQTHGRARTELLGPEVGDAGTAAGYSAACRTGRFLGTGRRAITSLRNWPV